jgi:hypothetical protein
VPIKTSLAFALGRSVRWSTADALGHALGQGTNESNREVKIVKRGLCHAYMYSTSGKGISYSRGVMFDS